VSFPFAGAGKAADMGENFPEGTSESDPSAVPPFDPESLDEAPPRRREEDDVIGEAEPLSGETDEEPENQHTG
jgi:hypothetical protein